MRKYTVITASRVEDQLKKHAAFLARVSLPAARRFRDEFAALLDSLEENPLRFPPELDPNLPEGMYRKALIGKWYKALFAVDGTVVYLDAVVDCRGSMERGIEQ